MANKDKEEKKKRRFFKDFKAELKRVVWPTPKQLLNNTIAVVTIVLVIGLIVFLLDFSADYPNNVYLCVGITMNPKFNCI